MSASMRSLVRQQQRHTGAASAVALSRVYNASPIHGYRRRVRTPAPGACYSSMGLSPPTPPFSPSSLSSRLLPPPHSPSLPPPPPPSPSLRSSPSRSFASWRDKADLPLQGGKMPKGNTALGKGYDLLLEAAADADKPPVFITGYDPDGFEFGDLFLKGSVMVFPSDKVLWRPQTFSDITIESLKLVELIEPKIEILVIGVGEMMTERLPQSLIDYFLKKRIAVEQMDTPNAIATFNFLNQEGRYAAAAMLSLVPYDPEDAKADSFQFDFNMDSTPTTGKK